MMMINAFITIKSGLVLLIQGLCAQIYYFRFEIIGGLRSHLLLFFFERINMLKKNSNLSKISSRPLAYAYICVLCTHIRIHICRDVVHLDSSGPSRCLIPTPGLTSEYPICAVCICVCVYTTPIPTYTPTHVNNRADTEITPIFPSVKNNTPRHFRRRSAGKGENKEK